MPHHLLIIDGREPPQPLLRELAAEGYTCHRARGPLKLRDTLAREKIHLILWWDGALTPDLAEDLFRECRAYPAIPIVHLYTDKSPPAALPLGLVPVDAIPEKTNGARLISCLAPLIAEVDPSKREARLARTELAFRHLVSRLHLRPRQHTTVPGNPRSPESFHSAGTGLIKIERELLAQHPTADLTTIRWSRYVSLLTRIAQRLGLFAGAARR